MMGLGLIVAFFGYAVLWYGLESLQGNNVSFISQILPFGA